MKRDSGMKDRDERSRGLEIRMTDDSVGLTKSNQQDSLDYPNKQHEKIETVPIPPAVH